MIRPGMLCIGLFAAATAGAADRKFDPVPQSALQHVQSANGMTILSASGQKLGAGASISASNSKNAWLSVSVKNTGKAPVGFSDAFIVVTSGGEKLNFRRAGEEPGKAGDDGLVREEQAESEQLGVGQLVARQYQVDLPKKAKREAVVLNVSITLDGEAINFVFMQAD